MKQLQLFCLLAIMVDLFNSCKEDEAEITVKNPEIAGNVFLTFYALRQSYPLNIDFTANTDPWVLNGLFMNRSVELLNGRSQKSYSFPDQFVQIVKEEDPCN